MVTHFLWVVAASLGVLVWLRKGRPAALDSLKDGAGRAVSILPRLVVLIVLAGFFFRLLPDGFVTKMLGPDTGILGVLFATLVGGLIPGGGSITFALVVMLAESGAGVVQLIALVTAWSVFAFHRVAIYEVPLMGARFSILRIIASLPLPVVAASISFLILTITAAYYVS